MILHAAITLAERIRGELAPFCERIEIAGSIRRARPEVNDIDFVVLPKPEANGANGVGAIKARCRQRCRVVTDGRQNFICALPIGGAHRAAATEFQIDIFFAHRGIDDLLAPQPTNFGSLLLCRTGSKEHNIMLCQRAKSMDMKWDPYKGVFAGGGWEFEGQDSVYKGGKLIASQTEEEIFEALGMKWVPPAIREVNFNPGPSIPEILNRGDAEAESAGLNASQPASKS